MLNTTVMINNAYARNEMETFIIYGPLGIGKTVFSIKTLAEVYGKYELIDKRMICVKPCYDWNIISKHIMFHPRDFINCILDIAGKERSKCKVWDDAGFWLSNYSWNERFVRTVAKYLNVARTHLSSIIFTSPTPLAIIKTIRILPQIYSVKIVKSKSSDESPSHRNQRLAIGYRWWRAPDMRKSGVKGIFNDKFNVMLPQEVYEPYMELRRQYADYAALMMKKELEALAKAGLTEKDFERDIPLEA